MSGGIDPVKRVLRVNLAQRELPAGVTSHILFGAFHPLADRAARPVHIAEQRSQIDGTGCKTGEDSDPFPANDQALFLQPLQGCVDDTAMGSVTAHDFPHSGEASPLRQQSGLASQNSAEIFDLDILFHTLIVFFLLREGNGCAKFFSIFLYRLCGWFL